MNAPIMPHPETIQDADVDTWKAEQAERKAERAAKREALHSDKAKAAELAAHLLGVTVRTTSDRNTYSLDVALVLGDLLCDATKDAVIFDVVGQPEIVIARDKLRDVAAELGRKRAKRGTIRCTLGGGLSFRWNTGGLTLRDQPTCNVLCTDCMRDNNRHAPHLLTPENSIRVVLDPDRLGA